MATREEYTELDSPDEMDVDETQWFENTMEEEMLEERKNGSKSTYLSDESDDDDIDDDDSLFFSDEEPNATGLQYTRSDTNTSRDINKTVQLGAEVAQAKQVLHQIYTKVEECERSVEDGREEVNQCRERQKMLKRELDVTDGEIKACPGNIPNVQRLNNLKNRLENELKAEEELEENLRNFVKTQELSLNQVIHQRGQYQHLEIGLQKKEKTLGEVKSALVKERKRREKNILQNAERKAINAEIKESLVNLEHEDRTKAAITAARKAQKDGQRFLKETWKRVKDRERQEEEEKRMENERRVKMLLNYKDNLHRTQHKLKKVSKRKARLEKDKELQNIGITTEERYQTAKQQTELQKQQNFEATQRQAKSALVNKILKEEQAIERRKEQQPHLFSDRLIGRHNKPTPQTYKHILDLTKPPKTKKSEIEEEKVIERTVGYSSSEDEDDAQQSLSHHILPDKEILRSSLPDKEILRSSLREEVLIEPEFRGLWEAAPPPKPTPPSKFSVLEQRKMEEVLQKQRENIVQKQITVQREFKGQAFTTKPEEVVFSDYVVGETYTQNLTLTNVSYTINTLKMIGLSTNLLDFITVEFSPPGHLSAGLTCDMKVTFTPLINKDITGEIKMLAQTGAFSIPVKCRIKRTEISVPQVDLNFGTVCVGEHQKAYITIINSGALGTNFKVRPVGWVNETPTTRQTTAAGDNKQEESSEIEKEENERQAEEEEEVKKEDTAITAPTTTSTVTFSAKETETLPCTPDAAHADKVDKEAAREPSVVSEASLPSEVVEEEEDTVVEPDITLNKASSRGVIQPFSTVQVEVLYNPKTVGEHCHCFIVSVADNSIDPVTVTVKANTIALPIYVKEEKMYLKYCMVDRLYQDSVILHNRATSALRIKFEIPKALKHHIDVLPQNGVVQANSSFSAQLKFIPLSSIFEDCKEYFSDGQLLNIPIKIRVADQTRCVPFYVTAHVTDTNISFSTKELDFGCCSIYESVRVKFSMTNHCLLPQMYGFVSLPDFVTIQPNDGFGTLLPGEELHLEAVVHAKILGEHNFNITCTTEIDRNFSLKCKATGVIPHLEVSQPLIRFAPTALGDARQASFYISNITGKGEPSTKTDNLQKSFHIVVPDEIDLTVSPSVGTLLPGQRVRVQLTFSPTLKQEDIEKEAFDAAKSKILEEIERHKKEEEEGDRLPESVATNKKAKAKKAQSKPITPKSPMDAPTPDPLDNIIITDENRIAAMVKLKTNFEQRFEKVLIPCFTTVGKCCPDNSLDYNTSGIVYLQVHLPTVKPELILLSQNGSSIVDFGNVCIGQTKKLELTLKSITDTPVSLSCSPFPHDGTFQKTNATRNLQPYGLHQMLLEFTPKHKAKYYEIVEVKTEMSTLHLHLHGQGVEPKLVVSPEDGYLDMGNVVVGEVLQGAFTLTNNSDIDLQYGISLLSEKSGAVQKLSGDSEIGNSNKSGMLLFQCSPHVGTINKGATQEITVKFKPDHQDAFKDVVIVNLLNQPQQTRITLKARAWSGSMYVLGAHNPKPSVTLHTLTPQLEIPEETDEEDIAGQFWVFFVCPLSASKQTFSRSLSIGNCRGAGVKPDNAANAKEKGAKPTGDFVFDPIKADFGPLAKALVINPPKGSVEVTSPLEVSFQFTPPKEMAEAGSRITFNTMLTLKGETIEQYKVNFVAEIVN